MIRKSVYQFLFVFQLLIIAACSPLGRDDPISINPKYVNDQILLRAPQYANTFKTNDSIILELKNNTHNTLTFPRNYNIKIFEDSKEGWIWISEKPTQRTPANDIVLSPKEESPVVEVVVVFPDLPDTNREYKLRIYVVGKMQEDEKLIEVGAYTDIFLYP